MKGLIAIIAIVAFAAIVFGNPQGAKKERTEEEKKAFKEWMAKHNKSYPTPADEEAAMERILDRLEKINAHNKLYDEGKVKYKQGLWEHSDKTAEERKMYLGGISPPPEETAAKSKRQIRVSPYAVLNSLYPTGPESIDWREKGLVGDVQDQGLCGSCWAFSVSQVVDAYSRKNNITTKASSAQQMIDCDKKEKGCHGGWPPHGLDYAVENGLTSAEKYPFVEPPKFIVVGVPTPPPPTCTYDPSTKIVQPAESITVMTRGNETFMRDVVASVGPVGVTMCLDESFHHYQEGVYDPPNGDKCCDIKENDHGPVVVGYGTNPKDGDYWIVKNSWGPTWGLNGYAKFARGKNLCNIGYQAMYAK